MKLKFNFWLSLIAVLAMFLAAPVYAQRVAADLNGRVTGADGAGISGVTVEIIHIPSGTTRFVDTLDGGYYTARGLRVGGPYKITAYKDGFQPQIAEGVDLKLGEPVSADIVLVTDSAELGSMEVIGTAISDTFDSSRMGAATTVSREQIENMPTISRSINDFLRLDPRITIVDAARGEISVGGGNSRFNNIMIDGVGANDTFGLNSNGQPATRQSISIDWLEQISIEVTPYDVKQSGATGGFINAVTKSGTNEFSGMATYVYRNDGMIGDSENGDSFPEFKEDTFGFNLGGPIIKDKLFFFVGYEKNQNDNVAASQVGLAGSGADTIFNTDPADVQRIIDIAAAYGMTPGNMDVLGALTDTQENTLAKIDWNISNNHRASFRYSNSEGSANQIRRNRFDYALSSNFYFENRTNKSYTAQLFSDWTPSFSTEMRASMQSYKTRFDRDIQPLVEVETDGGTVLLGAERFRHENQLDSDTTNFTFNGNYFTGDHSIDFGLDWYEEDYDNLFVFEAFGRWRFDSIDDFANGNTGVRYQSRQPVGGVDNARANWAWSVTSLYAQDMWTITPDFTVTFGFRYETFSTGDKPLYNAMFEDTYGFSNQGTVDGESLFQPRFGFNWSPDIGSDSQLRGGFGLFRGRNPGVWLSNAFTNPGGTIDVFGCDQNRGDTECTDADAGFGFVSDPYNQPLIGGSSGARQDVDVVEDGFNMPSDWKFNLAWDQELEWLADTIFTAEVEYAKVNDGINVVHLNLGDPTGVLPDGRNAYWGDINTGSGRRANADDRFNDVLLMENTSEGERTNITLMLFKNWTRDWGRIYAQGSWSWGDANDVSSTTSSRAISNWNNRAVYNPNEDVSATANTQVRQLGKIQFGITGNWFAVGDTNISAFFQHRSGRPFSWTFDNDANGDGVRDNDLLYVPANRNDVIFTDPADADLFWSVVNATPALRQAMGSVVKRNTDNSPDVNQLDMHFGQDFNFGRFGKATIYLNVLNVANLLNKDWGYVDQVPFEYVAELVNFEGIDPDTGLYIYDISRNFSDVNGDGIIDSRDVNFTSRQDSQGESRWSAQLGIRFDF